MRKLFTRTALPIMLLALLILPSTLSAQLSVGGEPRSFSHQVKSSIQTATMGYVDELALRAEDEDDKANGIPLRFGYPFEVSYTLENSGTWETLPDGGKLWRFEISCPGAYSINLVYDYFWLPEGAEFFIYNEDHSMILGAFTSQNNKDYDDFATGLVRGDKSILEYYEPANVEKSGIINISRIVHGYRDIFSEKDPELIANFGSSGSCNNNINCPEGANWQNEKRSVAMVVTSGGTRWCSGALINNVNQDLTPYFLTANHCLGSESTWIFYFNYESPSCSNIDGPLNYSVQGSTLLAHNSYSDFALLELTEAPPDSFGVYYSGWTTADSAATGVVGIHHPSGDIKKISFDYDKVHETSYLGADGSGTNHWRIMVWDDGTTEGGSSGSPLYDANHHIIGQLHGGYASCSSLTSDWYGQFTESWDYGSTASTRIKDWLDPGNTGATELDGIDAAGISISHTPLQDTKDNVNDYAVSAEIVSPSPLVPDSILLQYQINSTWYTEQLISQGGNDYLAYIPAQSPGTQVDYYIFAKDEGDDHDSTEIYSFYVIDYDIILDPLSASALGAVDDTLWYDFSITNNGVYSDNFSLTLQNNTWNTKIYDQTGTTEISSSGTLAVDAVFNCKVRVIVPISSYGDSDMAQFVVTSTGNASISASAEIISTSGGQSLTLPFSDNFPNTIINTANWVENYGATINGVGLNEPSEPYSLNMDGDPYSGDTLISQAINLKNETNVIVRYNYEQTGEGESPDSEDDLVFEYLNSTGVWVELSRHLGSGGDMTTYSEVEITLPTDAYHSGFRLKIYNHATSGNYDDWFVDDVFIGYPSDYKLTLKPSFQSGVGAAGDSAQFLIAVHNDGILSDSYTMSSSMGTWDVAFFDETGTTPLSNTGTIVPTDSVVIMAKVAIPAGTPIHATDTISVDAQSDADVMVSGSVQVEIYSLGDPAVMPWSDYFSDDLIDSTKWYSMHGIQISTSGLNEPSILYSLNLNGNSDTIVTQLINMEGQSSVYLAFYYERGGASTAPANNQKLHFEYMDSNSEWQEIVTYIGDGSSDDDFTYVNMEIPSAAYHKYFQMRLRTSGALTTGDWFVDNIRIDLPADLAVSPQYINEEVVKGDTTDQQIVIRNDGDGYLLYDIDVNYIMTFQKAPNTYDKTDRLKPAFTSYPDWVYNEIPAKGTSLSYATTDELKYNAGGPDDFGYYWIDSDQEGGPSFIYNDISSFGIDIIEDLTDDSYTGPINLGFDFEYYGQTYNQIYVGSNGLIGFDPVSLDARTNRPIPYVVEPNAILAWCWDDMEPENPDNPNAHVYYKSQSDRFVIQFKDYPYYNGAAGAVINAQVILFKNHQIKFLYKSIGPGFLVNSATVGIESPAGNDGLEVIYKDDYLHDSLAVQFYYQFPWLYLDQLSGTVAPQAADTIAVKLMSDEVMNPGAYTANVMVNSNDPINPSKTIIAEMELLLEPNYICGDANSDDHVNVSDAVFIINYVFVQGSEPPDPMESADVNCDDKVNVSDAVYIINYVFNQGSSVPCQNCP